VRTNLRAADAMYRSIPPRIVFSTPIDSTTLTTGTVQLWRGTTLVSGAVLRSDFAGIRAEFRPDSLLAVQTEYHLVVTQQIRDVNGMALDSAVTVSFTTGSTPPATGLRFAAVTAGVYHTCAVTAAGAAYCWGTNGNGELGLGHLNPGRTTAVPVVGGLSFAAVDAGLGRTCGITADGAAYCWGETRGPAGVGSTTTQPSPAPRRVA
jgi:alpha-tubulin suppressor-like RCC1 family protein